MKSRLFITFLSMLLGTKLSMAQNLVSAGNSTLNQQGSISWILGDINTISMKNASSSNLSVILIEDEVLANQNEWMKGVSVFPNPTKDLVHINHLNDLEKTAISIVDIQGKSYFDQTYEPSTDLSLDLSNYKSGLYIITLSQSGQHKSYKIIKK